MQPPGTAAVGGDCDDTNPDVQVPVAWYLDLDGDGWGAGISTPKSCFSPGFGYAPGPELDCDDAAVAVHPGAVDVCGDGVDQDCTGDDCVQCTEVVVGLLPSWGAGWGNASLVWTDLQQNWVKYGTCPLRVVDVAAGFDLNALRASGATVLWAGDSAGGNVVYSAREQQAIRDFTGQGDGGFVSTYLLEYNAVDNSALLDLVGVDPATATNLAVATMSGTVTVLDAGHPLAAGLPGAFPLASFLWAQGLAVPWSAALLPGATLVAQSADGNAVIVGYEGASRGALISSFPEYTTPGPDAERAIYDAAFWASGY